MRISFYGVLDHRVIEHNALGCGILNAKLPNMGSLEVNFSIWDFRAQREAGSAHLSC